MATDNFPFRNLTSLPWLYAPLGIAIVGGLIVSQLLTLYTTPVVYLMLDRVARRPAAVFSGA